MSDEIQDEKKPSLVLMAGDKETQENKSALVPREKFVETVPLFDLFCDQYGDPHAWFDNKGVADVAPVYGATFKDYVRYFKFKTHNKVLTDNELEKLVSQIGALARFEGVQYELAIRVADHDNNLLIDGKNAIYCVTPIGWSQHLQSIIKFRRFKGMSPLPFPITGGVLDPLLKFVNIKDEDDQLLLQVFVVSAFVPNIPHPILALHGSQGSGKSTLLKLLVALIDPWVTEEVQTYDKREFLLMVSHRWVVGLDNVSKIPQWLSDLLCKLVTGVAFSNRKLYTDEEEISRKFKRVVILNGVNLPVEKPDLLDRCLILALDRISDKDRQDEASLWKKFKEIHPSLLGGCLDLLSKAMQFYPTITLNEKPRLADFAIWGCAIAKALGKTPEDFLRAYQKNVDRQTEEALDASPLAVTILQYFRKGSLPRAPELIGTPTYILRELGNVADEAGIDHRQLPQSPRALGRAIQEIKPNLEARGYIVDRARGKERKIIIRPPTSLGASSSSSSLPSSSPGPTSSPENNK